MIIRRSLGVLILLLSARLVEAQTWPERVWVEAGGGVQSAASEFSDSFTIQRFAEDGTVSVQYPGGSSAIFDGGVGVRLWRRLGVGFAYTQSSIQKSADVTAQIPHPFFDNRLRSIEGSTNATHKESGAHIQVSFLANLSPKVRMIVSGGPSILSVEQTFVTDVSFSQEYPYDTATFTGATTHRSTASKTGFNVSADTFWMISKQFGAGGLVRFTRATVSEDAGNGRTHSVDAGGVQASAGIRFLF
jgi:hypothetical protein